MAARETAVSKASIAAGETNDKQINREGENVTVGGAKYIKKKAKPGWDRGRGGWRLL